MIRSKLTYDHEVCRYHKKEKHFSSPTVIITRISCKKIFHVGIEFLDDRLINENDARKPVEFFSPFLALPLLAVVSKKTVVRCMSR